MQTITRIGARKVLHAAKYFPNTQTITLKCNSLTYNNYLPYIVDQITPTKDNVTCKKCLKYLT